MTSRDSLAKAKSLIKNGRKKQAAVLLRQIVQENPNDYRPWLYLAMVVNPNAREKCIAQAESIAPDAEGVHKAKAWLQRQQNPVKPKNPQPQPIPIISPAWQTADTNSADISIEKQEHEEKTKPNRFVASILLIGIIILVAAGWFLWPNNPNTPQEVAAVNASTENGESDEIDLESTQTPQPTNTATAVPTIEPTTETATPVPTATDIAIQPKQIVRNAASEPRTQWTPTPIPTNTPSPTPTLEPTFVADSYSNLVWPDVGDAERWIDVNLTTQTLVAFEGKNPVLETAISSGRAPYYTVTGQFRIYYRLESQTMDGRRLGFDYVTEGVPHVQYFYGDFALHGAYWHNSFGQPVSHGCVNLALPDAEWLYEWADYGMLVNVHY